MGLPHNVGVSLKLVTVLALTATLASCGDSRVNVLVPDGSPSFSIMDFTEPLPLDPLPAGWYHRLFWRHGPMDISFETKEGVPAIRLATHNTASMLFRHTDVPLDRYPTLTWQWFIERGIDSSIDELTEAGDDHPARFFIVFETADGESHRMEIIWSNRVLDAGDYKYIGSFPHYVANGGQVNAGRWHQEAVDLAGIYRELWGDPADARIVDIAFFCDSDDTGGETVAYFANVRVTQSNLIARRQVVDQASRAVGRPTTKTLPSPVIPHFTPVGNNPEAAKPAPPGPSRHRRPRDSPPDQTPE